MRRPEQAGDQTFRLAQSYGYRRSSATKLVDLLVDEGLIYSVADLYELGVDKIAGLERMGDKSAKNLIESIENSKQTSLAKFLFSLGIREVGEATAQTLAKNFGSLESITGADQDALLEVDDVGPVVAYYIRDFFRNPDNLSIIRRIA